MNGVFLSHVYAERDSKQAQDLRPSYQCLFIFVSHRLKVKKFLSAKDLDPFFLLKLQSPYVVMANTILMNTAVVVLGDAPNS